jgi:hypothetical protein
MDPALSTVLLQFLWWFFNRLRFPVSNIKTAAGEPLQWSLNGLRGTETAILHPGRMVEPCGTFVMLGWK